MAEIGLQPKLVPLTVSLDGGTTQKTLVCLTSHNFTGTTSVTKEESMCGTHTGLGANSWEYSTEGVLKVTPESSELSYKELLTAWHNQTLVTIEDQHGTSGSTYFQSGDAYITSIGKATQVGSLVKFTITFTGAGDLDISA